MRPPTPRLRTILVLALVLGVATPVASAAPADPDAPPDHAQAPFDDARGASGTAATGPPGGSPCDPACI